MKPIFITLITACASVFLIQCSSSKKMSDDKASLDKISESKMNGSETDDNVFLIYCGRDSAYYNVADNSLSPNNVRIYYCLNEKAFQGDTASIRQAKLLINNDLYSLRYFKKPRGNILFKAVLERLNNFEFVNTPDGELSYFTYYNSYASILTDMIESIDGKHRYEYLKIHVKEKWTPEFLKLDIISREYIQAESKIYWEIYKEAYDNGLIKLKDFGQE